MQPVSAALAAALAGPGVDKAESWGELWQNGARTATVDITGGNVTYDTSAGIRASCRVTLPGFNGLIPDVATTGSERRYGDGTYGSGIYGDYRRRYLRGLLVPLKTELRLFWRGLLPGTTKWETVPLGRYTVGEPTYSDTPDGQMLDLAGYDAAADIAAAKWDRPFTIARGTNVATALRNLLTNRRPGLTVITPATDDTTPQLVFAPGYAQGGDPWEDATLLAASAGWLLYIDRAGRAVAEPPSDPSLGGAPVWELHDTGTGQRFVQTPNGADIVNTVIVYAESSGEKPVVAVVKDQNGPYGINTLGRVIAREYRASNIKTLAQAQNAGIALLRKWSTIAETVQVATSPLPHLEPSDLVSVSSSELELEDDVFATNKVVFDLDRKTPTVVTVSRRI